MSATALQPLISARLSAVAYCSANVSLPPAFVKPFYLQCARYNKALQQLPACVWSLLVSYDRVWPRSLS